MPSITINKSKGERGYIKPLNTKMTTKELIQKFANGDLSNIKIVAKYHDIEFEIDDITFNEYEDLKQIEIELITIR